MNSVTDSLNKAAPAQSFEVIRAHAEPFLQAIQATLMEQVSSFEAEIHPMIHYCLEKGGKRIRPLLAYFSGFPADPTQPPIPELVRIGAIVELVHMATLVHDDILDDATMRHARPSVKQQFGSSVAVLLGDALFAHALVLAAEYPTSEVCRLVATSTRKVVAGEIRQTFEKGDIRLALGKYYRAIELKTAELFRLACHLGAKSGGYSQAFSEAAGAFGLHLGNAYQIFDDMVDFFGSEQTYGKTLHTDLIKGKYTLPLLLLFERLPPSGRENLLQTLHADGDDAIDNLVQIMKERGIHHQVREHFETQLSLATTAIAPFQNLPPHPRLMELVDFIRGQIHFLA